jgi:predicted transcriptional regulator
MNLKVLQKVVESELGLGDGELLMERRYRRIVDARKLFSLTAKQLGHREAEIAEHLNQDRSTVYHSLEEADNLVKYNREFKARAIKIQNKSYEKIYSTAINKAIISEVKQILAETAEKLDKLITEGGGDVLS